MENSARIRINLSDKEFEIEGSEQFVKEYSTKIESMLSTLASSKSLLPLAPSGRTRQETELPATFGEYLHSFPTTIAGIDKMLIAAYYAQMQSTNNSFTTKSAHALLEEQGIKISNAARDVRTLKAENKVFNTTRGSFRVSQTGVTYISNLLAGE